MKSKSFKISISIIGAGIFILLYGFYRGELDIIFSQGIRVCLECIGIG